MRFILLLLFTTALIPVAPAAEQVQTLSLNYGWNSVWLEVAPEAADGGPLSCDQVFRSDNFRVDRVASPVGVIDAGEFTSDPESLFNQGGWDIWSLVPASGETSSVAVRSHHAYLVHVSPLAGTAADGSPAGTLEVAGQVEFHRPNWTKGSLNLVGFSVAGSPTFASLMAGSGIVLDGASAAVRRMGPDGSWEPVGGSDLVEPGKAYWIDVPYNLPGNGWAGPVEVDFPGAISGVLAFGSGPGSLPVTDPANPGADPFLVSPAELTFSNLHKSTGANRQVTITRIGSPGSGGGVEDLQFLALEPVPSELAWQTRQADLASGWPAANLGPGSSRSVTVGARRNWTTGLNLREHLYRISVTLDGGSVYHYLPVTATRPDLPVDSTGTPTANQFTGLWFGEVILGSVSSLNTAGAPVQSTPSRLSMRLFLHVDGAGQVRLVPKSILMQTKNSSAEVASTPVIVVNEARIPFFEGVQQRADGLRVGLRLETSSYDLPRDLSVGGLSASLRRDVAAARGIADPAKVTDEDVATYFSLGTRASRPPDLPETYFLSWPLDGQLGVGRTVATPPSKPLILDAFHRSNPFRHAFHPQHGAGYPVTRSFSISFETAPDPTILTGTYRETTRGLARQDIVSRGTISIRRFSTADSLQ